MDDATKKLVAERYKVLPQKIRELLLKPAFLSSIRIIAEKHHLSAEKATMFENEVVLTLLAFEPLGQFSERITAELRLPGSMAASIAHDVHEMIFQEVEVELQNIENSWEKEGTTEDRGQETALLGVSKKLNTNASISAWSKKTDSPNSPSQEIPDPTIQTNKRPITDLPRYVKDDPYREPPR